MTYHICTIFSEAYLLKGLALYFSLYRQLKNFRIWICCVDHASYSALKKLDLKNATILYDKEFATSELLRFKKDRKKNEYCWTLKAPLCLHILKQNSEVDRILYCDADVYFFSPPKAMYDEWAEHSVMLCLQRGTAYLEKVSGIYQAGIIGFRRDEKARSILTWWRDCCFEWCFDQLEPPDFFRYGDQKYLERIPLQFSNIKIVEHIGVDTAPWNIVMNPQYEVNLRGEQVYLDNSPLICFHYGSMEILSEHEFDLWKLYPLNFDSKVIKYIYIPYIRELQKMIRLLRKLGKKHSNRLFPAEKPQAKNLLTV